MAEDVFAPSEDALDERLRRALFELAKVVEDQFSMTPDEALRLAARLVGGQGHLA